MHSENSPGLASNALPPFFLEWWFAPWMYAPEQPPMPHIAGLLAQRDGYRLWCSRAGLVPELPRVFDSAWHIAALRHRNELLRCAGLFGGLFAARERDQAALQGLPRDLQRWCMSVALAQPLKAADMNLPAQAGLEGRGLLELGRRLEQDFPGLWSRLLLMLPRAQANLLAETLARGRTDVGVDADSGAVDVRAQRCWRICVDRMRSMDN
ncbi:hypothetical protein [Herbaspirillum sp. RV1423]|uniref:hypothetical protein n=1 Tax=Herbaspirillum sp. RV1423 TaxID=1443993 RepID=UPI0004B073F8|nr:hypothetical protein [Herbaspirillum sp. RV1423]